MNSKCHIEQQSVADSQQIVGIVSKDSVLETTKNNFFLLVLTVLPVRNVSKNF